MFEGLIDILQNFADRAEQIVLDNWSRLGKNATGQTASSLRNAIEFTGTQTIDIDIFGSRVFEYSNDGRPPGSKLPPKGVLLNWMQARGIPEEAEYPIRRAIAVNGIEPSNILEISILQINQEFNTQVAPQILQDLGNIILNAVSSGFELNFN
jgi:hypothetical protein